MAEAYFSPHTAPKPFDGWALPGPTVVAHRPSWLGPLGLKAGLLEPPREVKGERGE